MSSDDLRVPRDAVPAPDFVEEHAVPHEDAVCWAHLDQDDAYHPHGGYWFPSGTDFRGNCSGVVSTRGQIPMGELIQFPCEERPPYEKNNKGGDLRRGVQNVHVDATLGEGEPVPDGGRVEDAEWLDRIHGDLQDHPHDRVVPGFEHDSKQRLREIVEKADSVVGPRFHGFIVAATTTVHVYAEDEGVAGRVAVDNVDSGDLTAGGYGWPEEIWEADEDKLVGGWYYEDDDDYPLYEARLVAGGCFYMWAHDQAQVFEVGPKIIDAGDFGFCIPVNDWLANVEEVDMRKLAIQRSSLERRLENHEGGDPDE